MSLGCAKLLLLQSFVMRQVQQNLLERVYAHFNRHDEWPTARAFDAKYCDDYDPHGGLEHIALTIGTDLVTCGSPAAKHDPVKLHLRALPLIPQAQGDLDNFLDCIRFAAQRYKENDGNTHEIPFKEVGALATFDTRAGKRLFLLFQMAGPIAEALTPSGFTPSPVVARLSNVASLQEYLAVVDAFEERRRAVALAKSSAMATPVRHVFLSHAAADASLAEYLARVMRNSVGGLHVFVASYPGEIPTGSDWLVKIRAELRAADTYLVLLTPYSIQRLWLWFETGAAWMSERRLIPVTAKGLTKSDVPMPLGAHQALSLEQKADIERLFHDLGIAPSSIGAFQQGLREVGGATGSSQPNPRLELPGP
jgi:hypothetical protein